eukprot:GHVU01133300.1.p2 GENE.GHVU01133300.1~~GHVU01133300.1.p2  ORF type:complete len:155 (-),score=25.69 GHVU01133300.1:579-1043(-)
MGVEEKHEEKQEEENNRRRRMMRKRTERKRIKRRTRSNRRKWRMRRRVTGTQAAPFHRCSRPARESQQRPDPLNPDKTRVGAGWCMSSCAPNNPSGTLTICRHPPPHLVSCSFHSVNRRIQFDEALRHRVDKPTNNNITAGLDSAAAALPVGQR